MKKSMKYIYWVFVFAVLFACLGKLHALSRQGAYDSSYPRLFYSRGDIPSLRKKMEGESCRSLFENCREKVAFDGAFYYALTGDSLTFLKVKEGLLTNIETLHKELPRTSGIGAWYSGRQLKDILMVYDQIAASPLLTDEERTRIEESLSFFVRVFLNDPVQVEITPYVRTDYAPFQIFRWKINDMNVDHFLPIGLYGVMFPKSELGKKALRHAKEMMDFCLLHGVRLPGMWTQGTRYDMAVLRTLFPLAVSFKVNGIKDYFADPKFKGYLSFPARFMAPGDQSSEGIPLLPAVGDGDWSKEYWFILAYAASWYKDSDPEFAANLMWYWNRGGKPKDTSGLIFADYDMKMLKPDSLDCVSSPQGIGNVILRDSFAKPDETYSLFTFGPSWGTPDRIMNRHDDAGGFSIIHSGTALTLDPGLAGYHASRMIRDHAAFVHNTVTIRGLEKSRIIRSFKDNSPIEGTVTDVYPDGLTAFLRGKYVDYTGGDVRLWPCDQPLRRHQRNVFFLKPFGWLILDDLDSAFPLQWNFHALSKYVTQTGSSLFFDTGNESNMELFFPDGENIRWMSDWEVEHIEEDWPVVLSAPYGEGMYIYCALDIARQVNGGHEGAAQVLENILTFPDRPEKIGLIATDHEVEKALGKIGLTVELLSYEDCVKGKLSEYDLIVVGQWGPKYRERDLTEGHENITRFVSEGGRLFWAYQEAFSWQASMRENFDFCKVPIYLGEGFTSTYGSGIELFYPVDLADSPIWKSPNVINEASFDGWKIGENSFYTQKGWATEPVNPDRARYVPIRYSDKWTVHAAIHKVYNLDPFMTYHTHGQSRWIKIFHDPSEDYVMFLEAFKKNSVERANVRKLTKDEVIIEKDGRTYHFIIGNSGDFKGYLYVSVSDSTGLKEIQAVDATSIPINDGVITSDKPVTMHWDLDDRSGWIILLETARITFPRVTFDIKQSRTTQNPLFTKETDKGLFVRAPVGEYMLSIRYGKALNFHPRWNLACIEAKDRKGNPVPWADVYMNGEFIGQTDLWGKMPLRWKIPRNARKPIPVNVLLKKGDMKAKKNILGGRVSINMK